MARALKDEAQLTTDFVFFEYFLARHVINNLQFHQKGVQKLWVASMENLAARCAFLDHSSVLAVRKLDSKRAATTLP